MYIWKCIFTIEIVATPRTDREPQFISLYTQDDFGPVPVTQVTN